MNVAMTMAGMGTSCVYGLIFGAAAIKTAQESYRRPDVSACRQERQCEAPMLQKEEDIMQVLQLTLAALLASTMVASACQIETIDNAEFGWVRAQPSLYANQLWKLQAGVKVVYCGRSAIDDRYIEWRWVAFEYDQEQWPHKGWVSARILSPDVPVIRRRVPSFEEGGE